MEIQQHLQLIWWSHYCKDNVLIEKSSPAALLVHSGTWKVLITNKYQKYIKNTSGCISGWVTPLKYFSEDLIKSGTNEVAETDSEVLTIQISKKRRTRTRKQRKKEIQQEFLKWNQREEPYWLIDQTSSWTLS